MIYCLLDAKKFPSLTAKIVVAWEVYKMKNERECNNNGKKRKEKKEKRKEKKRKKRKERKEKKEENNKERPRQKTVKEKVEA